MQEANNKYACESILIPTKFCFKLEIKGEIIGFQEYFHTKENVFFTFL